MSNVFVEDDCTDLNNISKNNFQKIKNEAVKTGFADGIHNGRESVYQTGFDQGFKDGLDTGFNIEKYKYFFNSLHAGKLSNKALIKEKQEYEAMDCKSFKHYSLNVVPREHVKQTIENFSQIMPVATSLLYVQSRTDL